MTKVLASLPTPLYTGLGNAGLSVKAVYYYDSLAGARSVPLQSVAHIGMEILQGPVFIAL
jgi:hypothetical protein